MNLFTQPKWVAQAISLMVLGGVATLYFLWYVPHQRDYFASRNFRVLGLTSEEIQKTIEAFPRVLEIAAKSVESEHLPPNPENLAGRVRNAMALVPALNLSAATVENVTSAPTNLNTQFRLNGSWLTLEYRAYAGTNKSRLVTIQAKCDLGRLATTPQEFDGLLIAQDNGEVVFQRLPNGLSVQSLNKPDKDAPSGAGTNLLRRASSLMTARLAEHDYKFFVQPLQLAVPMQPADASKWLVCGLVRAERFNTESLEVSYFFLILCIFLVLFTLVSLVFPRVAFAGPREPLRRRSVFLLFTGTLTGASLLTILLLDVMVYPFAGATFDRTSERLAGMIRTNFHTEINELHRLIAEFDELRNETPFPGTNILTEALLRPEVTNIIGSSRVKFDMAFWTGEIGMQTHKWAVRPTATSLIDIRERTYVQDALNDRNSARAYREKGANKFWVEPIYSLSTGENSVVLAIKSAFGGVAAIETPIQSLLRPVLPSGHGFCVVTADGRVLFHSDVRRNLRENIFEECDDSPRLRSAVFSRTSQKFDINYLGRSHTFFVTPIENLSWTLVVFRDRQLLSAANFELVLLSLFLLAICFVAPLTFTVLILGVPRLLRSAIGTPGTISVLPRWLWPDPRRWKDYLFLGAFNLALAFVLVSLIMFLLPDHGSASWAWWVAGCAIAGALTGIVTTSVWLTCRAPGKAPSARQRQYFPWLYVAALISLLLLVAVVPAFASFNVALDMRIQLFVKHGQFTFAKALMARADRLREHRQIPGARDLETALRLAPHNMPWDVYAGQGLPITPQDGGPTSTRQKAPRWADRSPFDWLFEKIAPLRDPVSVETRGLLDKQSQDDFWSWDRYPNKLTLRVNNYRDGASLELTTPKLAIPKSTWLLTFAAISLLLLFPACFVAHRVFLIHLPQNASASEVLGGTSIPEHLLVLRDPPKNGHSLLQEAGAEAIRRRRKDTLEVDCRQDSFDAASTYAEPRPYVILDHFEHGGDDPGLGRRKLKLLDQLMSRDESRVIVSSARDPRSMKLEPTMADAAREEEAKQDVERWAQLWSNFHWLTMRSGPPQEQLGYRAIWSRCSMHEQLALYHVARHGLLHARNPELPILLGLGLLKNDRGLKLMTPGFHRFVRENVDSDDVRIYDEVVASKGWDILKGPVYVALVGVALLMFVTQPEIYKSFFGIITAFTAGPPAILKLLSLFESSKAKKAEA